MRKVLPDWSAVTISGIGAGRERGTSRIKGRAQGSRKEV